MTVMNAALLAAALLFVLFVVAQALLPALMGQRAPRETHARLSEAVARGTDKVRPGEARAAAFREAATIALDELRKPRLAMRYALWANQANPGEPDTIQLVATAMLRAKRFQAAERFLWRALDAHPEAPARDAAFAALLALYESRAPERARVLRSLYDPAARAN